MATDVEIRKLTAAVEKLARSTEKQNRILEVSNENIISMFRALNVPKEENAGGS